MKQKLGLACTLVRPPELLLLDEPTVGVDPVSRRELWQIVYRLVQQEGMTVLLSTAYLDEAERCHAVILMHDGEVLGQGSPQQFRDQSRGRTYLVTVPGGRKRVVQGRLAGAASVVDALIQGERVRLVMAGETPPDATRLLPAVSGVTIQPVTPRLEDSFVAMLKRRHANVGGAQPPNSAESQGSQPAGRSNGNTLPNWKSATPQVGKPTSPTQSRASDGEVPVIEIKDVTRRFGDFYAVKGVTFQVERGEVFGLLGANGAGKSTTFRMLCGLLPASAGSLRVAGLDLRHAAAAARARIGYMSQKFSLYGNLSVRENLRFFSSAYGLRWNNLNWRRWPRASAWICRSATNSAWPWPAR
jgi:ABC-2 type transport system ATP-binding protein